MTAGVSLRSLGRPYFVAVQENLAYMDELGGGSEFTLTLEIAFYRMPVQNADPDELHPLFSYHGGESAGVEILTIGATPSGRVKVVVPGGGAYTDAGLLAPDGVFRTISLTYTTSGTVNLTLDALTMPLTTTGTPTGSPTTGINRFMLFNGRDGLTRCNCAIRNAEWGDENGAIAWHLPEGFGYVTAEAGEHPDFINQDFTLSLEYFGAFFASPWGGVPSDPVDGAFRWQVATAYSEVAKPITTYTERTPV